MTLAHQILVAEGVLSGIVAVIIAAKANSVRYTPEIFLISLVWNLAFLGLLVLGIEHDAWQYWVVGAYGMASLLVGIYNGVTQRVVRLDSGMGNTVLGATILVVAQTALLVTAA